MLPGLDRDSSPLTGFCNGDVINSNVNVKLFFKAGYDILSNDMIESEYYILSKLQDYDFIPHIICIKQIGRYMILFMERINAISLDMISLHDPRYEIGIRGALNILHKLYIERGFLHKDMHPNNIIIDNNKVYLIDFSSSYLSPTL
jgi:RIO-like serine/threonine protein kinase